MSVQPQQQDLFKNGHQRWAPYAADQNFSQNQSINGAMSFANSQQTKQNNQIIAAFQNPPPTASAPHIHHTQQTVTQQQLQQQQQQQQQAVAVVSVPTQLQQVSQSSSQAPHTALIMGQVNQPPQNALPLGQFDKNSQNKFYSGTFQPLQRNGQFNYPVQLIAPQAGSQAQQVQPPYPNSAAQSLSSSQHQILSQQQSTQNPSQQQNLAGVNSQNSASSTGSSTSQTLNNSQNQGQQGQQAQGTSNNTSSLQQHNKNMLSVNGNLLGTTSASTNTSNQIGNSSNNINSNTNGSTNSTNCNQNSSNSNQTNGQSNMNGSHHNSSTNGGLSKGNTSSSSTNNNNNNNNNNSNSNNNNRESSSSNGQIYHRMGDVNLCKQNLCCMVCEKNICDDCQDHMKDHYALNIDKLFEQSFANQISSSQKSYQSCLDSLEKNEKTFIKFQEAIHELIDNAYHNYKIAEAYNNKDYKLFGQIFRKHYQMTQAQDNTQILSYQEKPESSVNQKDVIGKQFEKNYEKLYNFILIMNQITTDEITQHLGSQSTQSVPIYNVIGSSNIVSNQNTLNQQSNQAMSVQAAVQQSGGPLQMNAMNENNPQKIHIPPPPFPQHQAQGHLQNYQYIGPQIYDPHLSFPQGGNHPQGFYIHNPHVRYPPGMPMHNQHLKVNPNPANNYLIHQMPQNGGLNKPNSYQKQDFNSCIDQGPTKKIQTNPKQKPNISNSQSSVYNSTQNSMLSQNNYSSHSKQGQQYLNNSSTGQPQSQLSSEDSLPTQNEGQMINNQVGEPMIIENQNKLLSSDIIHTKQEAIELNSKTSSHSNLPVIQNLSQQGLNTQSKQSAQQQLDNSQRLQNASPQYSNNFSNPINNNSNGKIIVSLSAQNVPPEENSEHQQHKSKPQKKHKSDETKLIAYIEYTQNQSIKDLAKKYSVVEGTIKKWISDISNGKITFTQSQLNQQGLNSLPPLPTQPSTAVTSMTSVSPILAAVPPTTSSNNQIINQKIENLNSYDNEANQNSNSQSQQENEMDQNEEQSDERDQYDQKLQEQQHLESKLQKQPMTQKIENLDGIENDLAQNSQSESSSNKKDQIEKQNEMKLICFRMLKNSNFPEIPLETTIFALSKDGTLQIKYMPGGDQQDKLIYQENFNKRIKELKFQIIKQESIIFIHLEDDSLYMWRWQLKENYQLLQKRVQNFDAFVYFGNLFVIVQKGDMHIQVYTMDNKLISNISNIRPKEDCFGENYIINNLVGWGSEENKQWYICCNSGNYFWAYSLEINEQSLQTFFQNQTPLNDFKIIYEAFTEDCQEIFKMRLHKNQLTSQEVIGASDSGLLYIFDILKGRQSYFKMKSQGEKQMLDIQVFHPYNQNHENFQEQIEQDEPKIILCYDSFIRIRKYKKLQFPQGMRCATLEVKTQEIIIYYVQNSQDQILKHTLNS